MKAQGRAEMQQIKMAEAQRIQNIQMSETQRLQGSQFSEAQRIQMTGVSEAGRLQNLQISEAERLQGIKLNEAARLQQADIEGTKFQYGEKEARDVAQLNRLSGQQAQAQANMAAAKKAQNDAYGSMLSGLGSLAGGVIAGGGKGFD